MSRTSQLPDNLPQLQNLIKRDPESYNAEFLQQFRRYESNLEVFLLHPIENSKKLSELIMFIAQVSHCYPDVIKDFPQQLREVLQRHAPILHPDVRMMLCRAMMLLRNKGMIAPEALFQLFFQLFRCEDKVLRKVLHSYIIQDIKNSNRKHKNNKLNKRMQNFMYTMLADNSATAVKMSLTVMTELYQRKIWNDPKTVNVISTACFSKFSKILAVALRFFLGHDRRYADDSDSESGEDGPTARDIIVRFGTKKKTTRAKKKRGKDLKKLHRPKKKKQLPNTDFSAIHLLHDPEGFSERLFTQLQKSTNSFEIRLMMIVVLSRVVGIHKLFLFNLYPFLQRFLQPRQRDVTKILLAVAQATHELVPPEIIYDVIMAIANNFVTERNSSEVMAVGLNAVREICARCPLAMTEDLLRDLTEYQRKQGKAVMAAARSLVQLYRKTNPRYLKRKDRGRFTEATKELTVAAYGEVVTKDYVPGSEILPEDPSNVPEEVKNDGWESCSDDSDLDGSWQDVSSDEELPSSKKDVDEEEDKMDDDEKVVKSKMVSQTRIFSDAEFRLLHAHQASKEVTRATSKKKPAKRKMVRTVEENDEGGEILQLGNIEYIEAKKRRDRESRLATAETSRDEREKFGRKTKLNPNASTSNKQKLKNKPFMMVRHKMKKKHSGRSFKEKQIALRNALLKRAKHYK